MEGPEWKKRVPPEGLEGRLRSLYLKKAVYFEKIDTRLEWIYSPDFADRVCSDYRILKPWYDLLRGCIPEGSPSTGREPKKEKE